MISLFLSFSACANIQLLSLNKSAQIAIPAASMVFLVIISILLFLCMGRHLDDDIPLDKIIIEEDIPAPKDTEEKQVQLEWKYRRRIKLRTYYHR